MDLQEVLNVVYSWLCNCHFTFTLAGWTCEITFWDMMYGSILTTIALVFIYRILK